MTALTLQTNKIWGQAESQRGKPLKGSEFVDFVCDPFVPDRAPT
jgi:hypothetical protein